MPNTDIGIGLPHDQFFFLALPGDIPSESPVQRTRVDHWYLELGCRSPGGATVTSLALRCLDLGPWFQFLILLVGFKTKPLLEPRLENLDVLTSPHCSKNQQWLLQSFDYLNPKIGSIHNNRSFRQDRQSTSKTKRMWQGRRAWRGSGIKCQFTLLTNKLITPTAALNFIDTRTWAFQCIHQGSSGPNIGAVERDLQRLKETWLHLGSTVLEFFTVLLLIWAWLSNLGYQTYHAFDFRLVLNMTKQIKHYQTD